MEWYLESKIWALDVCKSIYLVYASCFFHKFYTDTSHCKPYKVFVPFSHSIYASPYFPSENPGSQHLHILSCAQSTIHSIASECSWSCPTAKLLRRIQELYAVFFL